MTIAQALAQLDPANDLHWTADGLPRMDAVAELVGDASITRKMVTDAAPELTRASAAAGASVDVETGDDADADADESDADANEDGEVEDEGEGEGEDEDEEVLELADAFPTLALPIRDVVNDYGLVCAALDELDELAGELLREKERVIEELRQTSQKAEILKRAKIGHERRNPKLQGNSPIADYLEGQRKAREDRAARARAFLNAGTTPQDVAAQLRGASQLDAAMSSRKAAPGSTRPVRSGPAS